MNTVRSCYDSEKVGLSIAFFNATKILSKTRTACLEYPNKLVVIYVVNLMLVLYEANHLP